MPSKILSISGGTVMELLERGETDKASVNALLSMLKPHATSRVLSNLMSRSTSSEDRRKWIIKQLSKQVSDKGKSKPSWLQQQMESGSIPQISIDRVAEMPDDEVDRLSMDLAETYSQSQAMKGGHSDAAGYLARIKDFGQEKQWTNWPDYRSKNPNRGWESHRLASIVYNLLNNAVFKISNLVELKGKLSKFSSVYHIDNMMREIREDTNRKIEAVWRD